MDYDAADAAFILMVILLLQAAHAQAVMRRFGQKPLRVRRRHAWSICAISPQQG